MEKSLYQENIMDHYKTPRNFGVLDKCDCSFHDSNPLCGDELDVYLNFEENKNQVKEVKFKGSGCAISIASASMLFENIKGKSISEITLLKNDEILKQLGNDLSVSRIKCALLGLFTLKKAIATYIVVNKINFKEVN